jgi:hypothetical protein
MLLSFLHLEALGYFLNDLCVKSALIQMKLNIEGDAKLSFEALSGLVNATTPRLYYLIL